jgi:HlyD family secretion protein
LREISMNDKVARPAHGAEIIPLVRRPLPRRAGRWLVLLPLLLAIAAAAVAWWSFTSSSTTQYVTVPATLGPVTRAVTATGTVNPELTIIVGSYVSGVIRELYCDYNTEVKKRQDRSASL